jgi:hypothetical protein
LEDVLAAMVALLVLNERDSLEEGGEAPYSSQGKQEAEVASGGLERITQQE